MAGKGHALGTDLVCARQGLAVARLQQHRLAAASATGPLRRHGVNDPPRPESDPVTVTQRMDHRRDAHEIVPARREPVMPSVTARGLGDHQRPLLRIAGPTLDKLAQVHQPVAAITDGEEHRQIRRTQRETSRRGHLAVCPALPAEGAARTRRCIRHSCEPNFGHRSLGAGHDIHQPFKQPIAECWRQRPASRFEELDRSKLLPRPSEQWGRWP